MMVFLSCKALKPILPRLIAANTSEIPLSIEWLDIEDRADLDTLGVKINILPTLLGFRCKNFVCGWEGFDYRENDDAMLLNVKAAINELLEKADMKYNAKITGV